MKLFSRMVVALIFVVSTVSSAYASDLVFLEELLGEKTETEQTLHFAHLPVAVPSDVAEAIVSAAAEYRIDPNLLATVAFKESRFDSRAVSSRGAMGVMQLMPRTAKALGVSDAYDPNQNIRGGARYLREMLDMFDGDVPLALAAYNAGYNRVMKLGVAATAESAEYVSTIMRLYQQSRRG